MDASLAAELFRADAAQVPGADVEQGHGGTGLPGPDPAHGEHALEETEDEVVQPTDLALETKEDPEGVRPTRLAGTGTTKGAAAGGADAAAADDPTNESKLEAPPIDPLKPRMAPGGFKVVRLSAVPQVLLEWRDISLSVPVNPKRVSKVVQVNGKMAKQLLDGVNGYARAGEMLAIMGASGAGKSTLLNVLARRNRKNTGSVTINGQPLTDEYSAIMSYIQQEDLFFGNLTVRQHLSFQARLRIGTHLTKPATRELVDDLCTNLGLSKAKNNRIGSVQQNLARGISGGERKRLSFASEVMTNPALLFVDEPTTGLDAYMAEGVMRTLRALADAGRLVLATIHQPSSDVWALFDRVCLLSDGRVAFFGDRDEATVHFSRLGYQCPDYTNPADFIVQVLAITPSTTETEEAYAASIEQERKRLKDIQAAWQARVDEEHDDVLSEEDRRGWAAQDVKPDTYYRTTWWEQFGILSERSFIYEMKDPVLVRARAFQTIFLAVLLGLIYLRLGLDQASVQDRNGALYFMMINQGFTGLFGVLQTFPYERPVFQREYENGSYSVSAYYLSKLWASLIPQIIFPVIFTTILFWMIGFHDDVIVWLWCVLIVFLVSQCATSLGYIISLATPNVTVALAIAPVILLPLVIFGGLFINDDSVPVYFIWLEACSFYKYGFSALTGVIWEGLVLQCPPSPAQCPFPTGEAVLRYLGFDTAYRLRDLLLLAGIAVFCRLVAFALLAWKAQKRQNE